MFTGLIEEIGTISEIIDSGDGIIARVSAEAVLGDISVGDSISTNGVCISVIESDDKTFRAAVMKETLIHSTAGSWTPGLQVNLERAVAVGDRLGGHIVQGHVDSVSEVLEVRPGKEWSVVRISLKQEIAPLVAMKGSIAIDGVSLTVSAVETDWAEVSLIPQTIESTTLGVLLVGHEVNVETDILARQVLRIREFTENGVTL